MSTNDITSHHIYGTEVQQIVNKIREVSIELQEEAKRIGAEDKATLRKNPEIVNLWHKLCLLHMKGLGLCEDTKYCNNACMYIKEPQVCQTVLGIPHEETCCGRFFGLE